jgi:hypothetical protein
MTYDDTDFTKLEPEELATLEVQAGLLPPVLSIITSSFKIILSCRVDLSGKNA